MFDSFLSSQQYISGAASLEVFSIAAVMSVVISCVFVLMLPFDACRGCLGSVFSHGRNTKAVT